MQLATLQISSLARDVEESWSLVGEAYSMFLRFYYVWKKYPERTHGKGLVFSTAYVNGFIKYLTKIAKKHPGETIPFEKIDRVIEELVVHEYLYFDARKHLIRTAEERSQYKVELANEMKKMVRTLTVKFFGNGESPADNISGISVSYLNNIKKALLSWSRTQWMIVRLFEKVGAGKNLDTATFTQAQLLAGVLNSETITKTIENPVFDEYTFKKFILDSHAFHEPGKNKIRFRTNVERKTSPAKYTFTTLSHANWVRVATDLFFKGYVLDEDRFKGGKGATLEETNQIYLDIRDFGVLVGLFDGDTADTAINRFGEIDLFAQKSEGNSLMSYYETSELIPILLSSETTAGKMHSTIYEACPNTGQIDPVNYPRIEKGCYLKEFFSRIDYAWQSMPELVSFYKTRKGAARTTFLRDLLAATRPARPSYDEELFDYADTEGLSLLPHYLESMFARFDQDHNGLITNAEVLGPGGLFYVFKEKLLEVTAEQGLTDDMDLKAVVTYLLANGEMPSSVQFAWWRYRPGKWVYSANRGRVIKILALIAELTAEANKAKLEVD